MDEAQSPEDNAEPTRPSAFAPSPALRPLPDSTVALLQQSWASVAPKADTIAHMFYGRLFELCPELRPLFPEDLAKQKRKLVQTLSVAVDGLSHQEELTPILASLGVRHAGYMVEAHHYDVVGEALLWSLRHTLGSQLSAELEEAWTDGYTWMAAWMKSAAAEAIAEASDPESAPLSSGSLEDWVSVPGSAPERDDAHSEDASTAFYTRLQSVDPALRPLFERGKAEAIRSQDRRDSLAPDGLSWNHRHGSSHARTARSSVPPARPSHSRDATPTAREPLSAGLHGLAPSPQAEPPSLGGPWSVSLRSEQPLQLQVSLAVALDEGSSRLLRTSPPPVLRDGGFLTSERTSLLLGTGALALSAWSVGSVLGMGTTDGWLSSASGLVLTAGVAFGLGLALGRQGKRSSSRAPDARP